MDRSIDDLCGNLGSLLKVSVNTDSVNDLLGFYYDEISKHSKEIAHINKRLDGLLNNNTAINLQEKLEELQSIMENQIKDFNFQLKELKLHQEEEMKNYKKMIDENYQKMQEQMNQQISELQNKIEPLSALEEKITKVANEFDELHEQFGDESVASKIKQSDELINNLLQRIEELSNNAQEEKEESNQKLKDIIQSLKNAGLLDENGNPVDIDESQRFKPRNLYDGDEMHQKSHTPHNSHNEDSNETERKSSIKGEGSIFERRTGNKNTLRLKIGDSEEEDDLTEIQKLKRLIEQQAREINNLKQVHFDFDQLDGMTPMDMLQEIRSLEARLSANESEVDRVAAAAYDITQQFDGTAVGAKGCRCLACGRPKPVVPSSTIHLLNHLQEVSNGHQPPLSARPGARVSTLIGEPSKSVRSARVSTRDVNPKPGTPRGRKSAPMSRATSFSHSGK